MFFKLLYKQIYKHKKSYKSFLRFVGFLYNYAKSTFWGVCIIRKADNATVSNILSASATSFIHTTTDILGMRFRKHVVVMVRLTKKVK